jgi:HTH-type transcriptional regulator/antitoxin HigA
MGISARELARRCGRSAKLITEIILGKAPLEPETALQFERVLGMNATVWLNMEAAYRLHLARVDDERRLAQHDSWAQQFPIRELERRGYMTKAKGSVDRVRQFIQFFGVGSVEACRDRSEEMVEVAFRHSPSFTSSKEALLVWLRMGEIEAEKIECAEYDRNAFIEALRQIRKLTILPIEEAVPRATELCARAGVAFVIVRPVGRLALSGISRWLTPRKAMIQQTLRHLSNDHFWFTFFHEAAHLLHHSRKSVFIDGRGFGNASDEEESQANAWATEFLVPQQATAAFEAAGRFHDDDVVEFAEGLGIHPGIIVGQLQHRRLIGFSQLNHLKARFKWPDD